MNYMRTTKVFAVLVALSLASTASNGTSELEDQYKDRYEDRYEDQYYVGYVGLNFGTRWGESFQLNPSVVFGYHHNKNSKFELEVLTNISDITDKQKRKVGASLLANYRYYPDFDIDPIKLYASVGLGGYIQVLPSFEFGVSDTEKKLENAPAEAAVSSVNKILDAISYKLKIGVDCEITQQIVATVAIAASGQLSDFKPPVQILDAIIEGGIRYNF